MPYHDEKRLLAAVKSSDPGAFKYLYEQYQPLLFRTILVRIPDADLAHDIVQETFTRVWERRRRLKPRQPFYPYIYRIGINLLKDHVRREKARGRLAGEAAASLYPDAPLTEDLLAARELEAKIRKIVDEELGKRCRTVFLLSRAGGKANSEIAAILDLKLKTVENQITHALKVLRDKLGRG